MEGALGYGHWTCQRFMSHDSKSDTETAAYSNSLLSAITTASDALDNYTGNLDVLHIHGKSRQSLWMRFYFYNSFLDSTL